MGKKSTRRNVLKGLTGLGGISAFGGIAIANSRNLTDVIVARSTDGPEIIHRVETEWNDHRITARRANEKVAARFAENPIVSDVAMTLQNATIGEQQKFKIKISVDTPGVLKDIPQHVDGIPVEEKQEPRPKPMEGTTDNCTNMRDFDSLPGGVKLRDTSQNKEFTSGWVVEPSGGGGWFLVTCGHGANQCNEYLSDGDHYIHQTTDKFGRIVNDYPNLDVIIIDNIKAPEVTFAPSIKEAADHQSSEPGSRRPVKGWITQTGSEVLASENYAVYKMGIKTGRTQGEITDVNSSPSYLCYNLNSCGIQTTCNSARGDSGGPAYWFDASYESDDRSAYVLSMGNLSKYGSPNIICDDVRVYEYSTGVSAWKIHRMGYDPVNGVGINPGPKPYP